MNNSSHVSYGGAFKYSMLSCKTTSRSNLRIHLKSIYLGFRVARRKGGAYNAQNKAMAFLPN